MGFKYPILSSKKIIQILLQLGFYKVSQKGSHAKYKNINTNKICIIPMHEEVARETLKSILEQADIELEDFLNHM